MPDFDKRVGQKEVKVAEEEDLFRMLGGENEEEEGGGDVLMVGS